jgi:hypothetical protein
VLDYIDMHLAALCSYSKQTPAVVGCQYWARKLIVCMNSVLTSSYFISVNWIRDAVFNADCDRMKSD